MRSARICVVLLLSFLIFTTGCTSKEERVNKYFSEGLTLLEQKNYLKASLAFKNVLQIRPKHAEARFHLGVSEEKQKNWRVAFGNYLAAVELSETLIPPRIRLAELYLLATRVDKATELADEILKINPNHAGGLALRGRILSKNGDKKNALANAKKAVSIEPANVTAVILLSSLYIQQGKNDEGIAALENGVLNNPDNMSLKLILSKKYAVVKKNVEAEKLLRQLIKIEPDAALHRVRLADFQTSIGLIEQAESTLRQAIDNDPHNANLKLVLSNFLLKRRGEKLAEQTLQAFIETSPQESILRFGLAQLYNQQEEREKLKSVYESIIELDSSTPARLRAKSQLAGVYLADQDYDKALTLVEDVLLENPNDQQALFTRGALSLRKNDLPGAIADFRALLKNLPNSVLALSSLAKAHAINNEFDLAKNYLQKAIAIDSSKAELHHELAKVLILLNDEKSALAAINRALSLDDRSLSSLGLKANILIKQENWKKAGLVAKQVQKIYPNNSLGSYLQGLISIGQKNNKQAIIYFKKANSITSNDVKALKSLLQARIANKEHQSALKDVTQYLKKNPEDYLAYNLLGDVYLAQSNIKLSEKAFIKAKELNPSSPDAYKNLARIYLYNKQPEKSIELLTVGAKKTDQDVGLLLALASVQEINGNEPAAMALYEIILEKNPDVAEVINNYTMLLIKNDLPANITKAHQLIKKIEGIDNPFYQDTVGWVKFKKGDVDGGLQHILTAYKAVPDNAEINFHLAMIYQNQENQMLAKKHLNIALSSDQDFNGIEQAGKLHDVLN